MRAHRPFIAAAATAACVLLGLGVGPARAMTSNSTIDGNDHPAVVDLLFVQPFLETLEDENGDPVLDKDGKPILVTVERALPFCTGTVIRERVVLTASHCADYALEIAGTYPNVTFAVTNDPVLPADQTQGWFRLADLTSMQLVADEGVKLNPSYKNVRDDVSVVLLKAALSNAGSDTWPRIPDAGMLNTFSRAEIKALPMTVVGYGSTEKAVPNKDSSSFAPTDMRRNAILYATTMDSAMIHQSQKVKQGEDGACFGDSGGPTLIEKDHVTYVVAVTSTGDMPCWSTNVVSRVDRPEALDFLRPYL